MKLLFQLSIALALMACGISSSVWALPIVTSISPSTGPAGGGTIVTITGSGFTDTNDVNFGPLLADSFTIDSDTSITATSPQSVPGVNDITVTTSTDTSATSRDDLFTFLGNWICYIPQSTPARLMPLNVPANTMGSSIPLGGTIPFRVAITADGRLAVVGNRGSNSVNVVDLTTNTFTLVSAGNTPNGVAITPDGTTAYVVNIFSSNVTVINLVGIPSVITTILVGSQPQDVAITPDGLKAYVSNRQENTVSVIDTVSNTVTTNVIFPVNTRPAALAITPDGSKVYVIEEAVGRVGIISTATDTIIGSPIVLGVNPSSIAIAPNGLKAYVGCITSDVVKVIDLSTDLVIDTIALNGASSLAITADSLLAYVAGTKPDSIVPVDLATDTTGTLIMGFVAPSGQKISPDQAPLAKFQAIPGVAGSPTSFDASDSVSPVGTITTYEWDFGDSATETTGSPTTTHTYATAGNFTVTLTVTNSGTTSTAKTFSSQMMSNNGDPIFPVLSKSITITSPPPPPPSSIEPPSQFHGKIRRHIQKHKPYFTLHSKWKKSPSSDVISYQVYGNNKLLKTVSASSKLHFYKKLHPKKLFFYKVHDYKKFLHKKYKVRAVSATGVKSSFVRLGVKFED